MNRFLTLICAGLLLAAATGLCACPQQDNAGQPDAQQLATAPEPAGQQAQSPGTGSQEQDLPPGWVGEAIDFTFTSFGGETIRASGLGKPLIVNFWASW